MNFDLLIGTDDTATSSPELGLAARHERRAARAAAAAEAIDIEIVEPAQLLEVEPEAIKAPAEPVDIYTALSEKADIAAELLNTIMKNEALSVRTAYDIPGKDCMKTSYAYRALQLEAEQAFKNVFDIHSVNQEAKNWHQDYRDGVFEIVSENKEYEAEARQQQRARARRARRARMYQDLCYHEKLLRDAELRDAGES